jgi:hypothetical protein
MISLMTTYGLGVFSSLGKIDDVVVALRSRRMAGARVIVNWKSR